MFDSKISLKSSSYLGFSPICVPKSTGFTEVIKSRCNRTETTSTKARENTSEKFILKSILKTVFPFLLGTIGWKIIYKIIDRRRRNKKKNLNEEKIRLLLLRKIIPLS